MQKHPLLLPILLFLSGVLLAGTVSFVFPASSMISLLLICLLFMVLLRKKTIWFYVALCIFFLLLGAFRYTTSVSPARTDISNYIFNYPEEVTIYGTVDDVPEEKGTSYLRHLVFTLRARGVLKDEEETSVTGKVRVYLYDRSKKPRIGDEVVLGGKISLSRPAHNPCGFDQKKHLARKGIHAVMVSPQAAPYLKTGVSNRPGYYVRRILSQSSIYADEVLRKYLSSYARSITRAVTLGKRTGMPQRIKTIFAETGTMHVLAVSGLHIGIVAVILVFLLKTLRCPRKIMCFLTITGVLLFAVFAGARPSSLRAAIMASCVLIGVILNRKTEMINILVLSAFLITFFSPDQLFMPGFILSYLAVICILYFTPFTDTVFMAKGPVSNRSPIAVIRGYLLKSISVSFAVFLGMMPVIAAYFRIITPSAIIANLVAVPLLFILVSSGLALLITGSIGFLMPLAKWISLWINVVTDVLVKSLFLIGNIPFSHIYVPSPGILLVAIFYVIVMGAAFFFTKRKKEKLLILFIILFLANLFVWNEVLQGPPEKIKVTFFDTGKSDTFLIESPDGSVVLIDGGVSGKGTNACDGRKIIEPYLRQSGIRKIDAIILTHAHDDHMGGLFHIAEEFDVGYFIDGKVNTINKEDRRPYAALINIVNKNNSKHLKIKRGDSIKGIGGITLYVLNPPRNISYKDANNDSVVIKAVMKNGQSILFCADVETSAIKDILQFGTFLDSDIVKMPHHGGGVEPVCIMQKFLDLTSSEQAIITNLRRDKISAPVLEELEERGIKVYITGEEGALELCIPMTRDS